MRKNKNYKIALICLWLTILIICSFELVDYRNGIMINKTIDGLIGNIDNSFNQVNSIYIICLKDGNVISIELDDTKYVDMDGHRQNVININKHFDKRRGYIVAINHERKEIDISTYKTKFFVLYLPENEIIIDPIDLSSDINYQGYNINVSPNRNY